MTHSVFCDLVWVFGDYYVYDNCHGGFWCFYHGNLFSCYSSLEDAKDDIISRSADDYYLSLAVNRG